MSTGSIRETEERTRTAGTQSTSAGRGSVWWGELLLGAVCWATAALIALLDTTVGPFANLEMSYGAPLTALYLAVALGLGSLFVRKGLRQALEPATRDADREGR